MPGVVAAGHPQTAEAGAEMLRQGGNAVDAAIAAAFTAFVTESALVNIGAGGIAQVYDQSSGQAVVYDFFSTMPGLVASGQTPPQTLDFRQVLVDFGGAQQPFYIGRSSVAVPGAVAGLCQMVEEMGRLPLRTVLSPAIHHASQGVILTPEQGYITNLLQPILTDTPAIAAIYAPNGQFVQAGDQVNFPDLAQTLTRLAKEGAALFYTGEIGRQIAQDQQQHGGLLTETDLARYQVFRYAPIRVSYRDYSILLPPFSSKGGPLLAFALQLLAQAPPHRYPYHSVEHLQILAEVMRLTNIAREEWESGAHLSDNQAPWLLQPETLQKFQQLLKETLQEGEHLSEPPLPKGPANTTHLSTADDSGMVVSLTVSAGENAGFMVGETGLMLNNMLGEVDLHPNGFHQHPTGQRLATMMSPTLVLQHERPILTIGSGGSTRLRSALLQTISNLIDFDLSLETAIIAPRIHFEEEILQLEGGFAPEVAAALGGKGYQVNPWSERNMYFGGAHGVLYVEQDETWLPMGDPRRGGSVAFG